MKQKELTPIEIDATLAKLEWQQAYGPHGQLSRLPHLVISRYKNDHGSYIRAGDPIIRCTGASMYGWGPVQSVENAKKEGCWECYCSARALLTRGRNATEIM